MSVLWNLQLTGAGFSSTDIVDIIDIAVFVSVLSTIVILLYYIVQISPVEYDPFLSVTIFKSVL